VDRKKLPVASCQLSVTAGCKSATTSSRYAIVPVIIAGVAVATPFLLHSIPVLGFALQRGFALVCHQQPERSFFLFGGSVAVCARCLGIYLGAAIGLLLRAPRRIAMQFLISAVVANALDRVVEIVGLHGNWMIARFVLGVVLGTAAAMLIAASCETPTQATEA
jgi:uncharacterized membrane protein